VSGRMHAKSPGVTRGLGSGPTSSSGTPDPAAAAPWPSPQSKTDTPDRPAAGEATAASAPVPASQPGAVAATEGPACDRPYLQLPAHGRRCARKADAPASPLIAEQRLPVLDSWQRGGRPGKLTSRQPGPVTTCTRPVNSEGWERQT
jgi:hypothetical protein